MFPFLLPQFMGFSMKTLFLMMKVSGVPIDQSKTAQAVNKEWQVWDKIRVGVRKE